MAWLSRSLGRSPTAKSCVSRCSGQGRGAALAGLTAARLDGFKGFDDKRALC